MKISKLCKICKTPLVNKQTNAKYCKECSYKQTLKRNKKYKSLKRALLSYQDDQHTPTTEVTGEEAEDLMKTQND